MRLFISFSSRDLPAVRELMGGFRSQNIDFWDYSNEIEKIEFGEVIDSRLFSEIERADYFVAVISTNSTNPEIGRFTLAEVQHALDIGLLERERIIPIELQRNEDKVIQYLGAYKKLEPLLHHNFEIQNTNSYIAILEAVAQRIRIPFVPLVEAHPRLPFRNRFRDEVMTLAHSNSTHVNLMTSIGKFNEFMKKDLHAESYAEITYFIVVALHLVPDYRPVYPYIVKAVCAQELGYHEEAEKSYELALQNEPANPDALGGLGIVNLFNGNYDKAADLFERASQKSDPDQARNERVNKVIAILSGRLLNRYNFQDKEFVLNISAENLAKEDEKVFTFKAQALIYYHDCQFGRAVKIYKALEESDQLDDTGSVIYFYLSEKLMGTRNPHEILVRGITNSAKLKNINSVLLWEYLATYFAEVNQIDQAKAIFRDYLLPPHQNSRSLMASYAILLKKSGDEKACRDTCIQILPPNQFGIPATFPDFYYCGLANYLLGNKSRAEYDFERSNGFGQWYETVV